VVAIVVIVITQQIFRCTRQYPVAPVGRVNFIKEQLTLQIVAQ